MSVAAVSPEDSPTVLAMFLPQLQKALKSGQGDAWTLRELVESAVDGSEEVWAVHQGENLQALTMLSVREYQTGRKVFVSLLVGDEMDAWADELEAALFECRDRTESMCVEASCRPALAAYLKQRGWKQKAVIMEAPQ